MLFPILKKNVLLVIFGVEMTVTWISVIYTLRSIRIDMISAIGIKYRYMYLINCPVFKIITCSVSMTTKVIHRCMYEKQVQTK